MFTYPFSALAQKIPTLLTDRQIFILVLVWKFATVIHRIGILVMHSREYQFAAFRDQTLCYVIFELPGE